MKKERRYSKSENTKQFIIEKVAPIFNVKGFAGTSLSDITEATGLTKGAIYGNFRNKDEIAIEAFKYNFSLLSGIFNAELAGAGTPLEKLRLLPKAFLKIYPKVMSIGGCPLLNTIVDTDDTHDLLKELSARSLKGMKKMIEQIFIDCVEAKLISPEVDPDKLSALFLTLSEGGLLIAKTMNQEKYFEGSIMQMEEIIDRMIL